MKIKEVDPDVVILTEIDGISSIMTIASEIQWVPRGVSVLTLTGFKCNETVPL